VIPGGGDLQDALGRGVPCHLAHIGGIGQRGSGVRLAGRTPLGQTGAERRESCCRMVDEPRHGARGGGPFRGACQGVATRRRSDGVRERSRNRTYRPVQGELADRTNTGEG
jgi:hypothetical protein